MGWSGYRFTPKPIRRCLSRFHNWLLRSESLQHERSRPLTHPLYNIVVPADEKVHLPLIWAVEMFPPSYAASMARNIQKAGWRATWPSAHGDVQERVRRARVTGTVNSTTLARLLSADEPAAHLMGYTPTRLPKEYRSIEITMIELQNSLTAIVAAFELSEPESLALDRLLHVVPEPEIKPLRGGGHSIRSRIQMSGELIEQERARMRAGVRRWLSRRVPGVFALEAQGHLPVMDLLVTTIAAPFESNMRDIGNYLPALGIAQQFYQTVAPELPGLRFSEYQPDRRSPIDEPDLFNLSGRLSDILSDDEPYFNGRPRTIRAITARVSEDVGRYMSRLAISSLLSLKARQSAKSRDAAYALHGKRSIRSIKSLRESFLRGSLDTLAIAAGIKALTSDAYTYKWNVPEFETELDPKYRQPGEAPKAPENQLDYLANVQREQADLLIQADADTRQILGVVASLTASVEGMRTQRWGFGISVLSLLVALVAVVMTVGWGAFWTGFGVLIAQVFGAIENAIVTLFGF
ncbi:hypothetical protein [Agromyces subbeticus]|uniref:hypothetical protein n=1 Tax=Agromyces subbeticus TaxID=293890 RepID=UPI0012EC4330|nr:hypothetical protein [Agromyces subbeticus]